MRNFNNKILTTILLLSSLTLVGCTDKEDYTYSESNDTNSQKIVDENARPNETVPAPELSSGQILNIRLVYAVDEKDENNDEWYMVELKRNDSRWHDLVKIQGLIRSAQRHWDDYTFSSNNFNWQVEMEQYGTKSFDGDYTLIISGSNGYNKEYKLNWKNGNWTNINPASIFYVP